MRRPRLRNPTQRLVRRIDPDVATSLRGGEREQAPGAGGLDQKDVDAIWNGVVGMYKTRLYPAIQITMRRRGRVVLDRAIGHCRGNSPDDAWDAPLDQATPATRFNLFSATKLVTAMLVHLLNERGQVHLDDPVAHYIPEFGQQGKEWITLRHVLTHRAGIPSVSTKYADIELFSSPEKIMELICATKPTLKPGRRLAYHALTGGYVLAEVIERVSGKDVQTYLRDNVAAPLGFDHFRFGIEPAEIPTLAENAFTGPPLLPPVSNLLKRALGVDFHEAVRGSNDPMFLTAVVPAGNLITTANEASKFMQMLLNGGELDGVRIFEPRTIQRAVAEQSYLEMDLTLLAPVRYGMGFMLGSDYVNIYGHRTRHAFGHLGFTNVVTWADPERDISVCLMTSGKPVVAPGVTRWLRLLRLISSRCPRDWGRP